MNLFGIKHCVQIRHFIHRCYSNSNGEFSQMSGFVKNMVGDTAEIGITYGLREVSEETNQINFYVVLD